jgi:hypothetical protein
MKFKKNTEKLDKSLLGFLAQKQLTPDLMNLNEIKFHDRILQNGDSCIGLFQNEDGTNVAFYIDQNNRLNMVSFNNSAQVLSRIPEICLNTEIKEIKVIKLKSFYVFLFILDLVSTSFTFRNQNISLKYSSESGFHGVLIQADEKLDYLKHHLTGSSKDMHVAANKYRLLYINSSSWIASYDFRHLSWIGSQVCNGVNESLDRQILDLEASDKHLFVLYSNQQLKIFQLKASCLVKEINVNANQLKLVSTDYLALFNSTSRTVYLYNQDRRFDKVKELNLTESIEPGSKLSSDKTKFIAFYNNNQMKCACSLVGCASDFDLTCEGFKSRRRQKIFYHVVLYSATSLLAITGVNHPLKMVLPHGR